MAAKKKKTTRKKSKSPREVFDENLRSLERQLPPAFSRRVREMRKNMKALERQIDKARTAREARWHRLETQIRKDAVKALKRLELAIEPAKPKRKKKKTAKKKTAKKKTAAA